MRVLKEKSCHKQYETTKDEQCINAISSMLIILKGRQKLRLVMVFAETSLITSVMITHLSSFFFSLYNHSNQWNKDLFSIDRQYTISVAFFQSLLHWHAMCLFEDTLLLLEWTPTVAWHNCLRLKTSVAQAVQMIPTDRRCDRMNRLTRKEKISSVCPLSVRTFW